MIERLCLLLLRRAAGRWRDDGEMLAEWRAELYTMDSRRERLRFAASLAASRPHRTRTIPLSGALPGVVVSFLLLLTLPIAYLAITSLFWRIFSSDTVVWQSSVAVACGVGAVAMGVACARMTSGVTQVIKPLFLPAWVFGVPFLVYLTLAVLSKPSYMSTLIDTSVWLAGAIGCGIVIYTHGLAARYAFSPVRGGASVPRSATHDSLDLAFSEEMLPFTRRGSSSRKMRDQPIAIAGAGLVKVVTSPALKALKAGGVTGGAGAVGQGDGGAGAHAARPGEKDVAVDLG